MTGTHLYFMEQMPQHFHFTDFLIKRCIWFQVTINKSKYFFDALLCFSSFYKVHRINPKTFSGIYLLKLLMYEEQTLEWHFILTFNFRWQPTLFSMSNCNY